MGKGFTVREEGVDDTHQYAPEYKIFVTEKNVTRYPCPYDEEKYLRHPEREREIEWLWEASIPDAFEVEVCPHEVLIRKASWGDWKTIEHCLTELLNKIPS